MQQGYKHTELGVIPERWGTVAFNKCFKILSNNTLSRAELSEEEGLVKNIHYGDILVKYDNVLNCATERIPYIRDANKTKNCMFLTNGDLVIADTAEDETVGKAVEIVNVGEQKVVSGLHTIPCRPTFPDMFADGWLGYYINHSIYHDQLLPFITGTKVSAISKSAIAGTLILVPPMEEQERIAEALSDVDSMISSLEKLIAKKKAIKQGAMQELLTGKKRLPGFAGEWVHMELGQHGTLIKESINPQQYPTEYFWEYSMPAFDAERVPIKRKGTDMHSNRTMIAGQVLLFNKLNVRQKRVWLINQCQESAVCSSEFLPYQSDEINLRLLAQILFTDKVTLEFIGMSTGTSNSQKRITPDDFLGYKVYLPIDEKEQSALAEVFACMDNEIEALERELVKTRQIKQGMMQQLLTGKIRLV